MTIGYAIPKEGAQMFFDNLAIPKDARNVKEAHALINYLLRPEVAAKSTNFLGYANGDTPDPNLIDKAVLDDRTVYPDADDHGQAVCDLGARSENPAADEPAVDAHQDRAVNSFCTLPPAAMQPQPLFGMLAHPALDDIRDRLHRALNVDLALGIAHGFEPAL